MTAKFLPTVLHGQGWTYVRLSGVIDEDNRLRDLLAEIRGDLLMVDLVDIERINSCGVRDWVNWLEEACREREDSVLIDCAPAIVAQLNLVGNFSAGASVSSIVAPYYCESCDLERSTILAVRDLAAAKEPSAPTLECEACANPMSFDDIEESYFAFLQDVRPTKPYDALTRALMEARDMLGEPVDTPPAPGLSAALATRREPPGSEPGAPTPGSPEPEAAPEHPAEARTLSRGDIVFFVAVGVLTALLIVVVYQLAVP